MAQPPLLSEEGNTLARCFFLVRWKQFYAALFSFRDRFTGFLGSSVTGFWGASSGIDSFLASSFLRFWSFRCLSPYVSLSLISGALSGQSTPCPHYIARRLITLLVTAQQRTGHRS